MTVCYHSTQHLRIHQSDFATCLPLNRTQPVERVTSTSFGHMPSQAVSGVCPMPGIQSMTFDPDCHSHASATHLSRVRESSVYSGRSFKSLGEAESWCG